MFEKNPEPCRNYRPKILGKIPEEIFYSEYKESEKLNSNPYLYEHKFILTSKQKYNPKFQQFETFQTLKIQKTIKCGPKKCPRINDYEKPTKKDKRMKKKKGFLEGCLLFSFLLFC